MNDPLPSDSDSAEEEARGRLLDVVRLIHAALPESNLSARQRLDVRRDLLFLVDESARDVFRPEVAEVLCAAVLAEVARSHPAATKTALRVLGVVGSERRESGLSSSAWGAQHRHRS